MKCVLALTLVASTWPLLAAEPQFVRVSKYLNGTRAVVSHTMDDSEPLVLRAMDLMDRYGIKATFFVSTRQGAIEKMWPRLRAAIKNGHEIGSHSRSHSCAWPATEEFCRKAYNDSEVTGTRDDILKNTDQGYVWSWCYPCGLCADRKWVQDKLASAGYLVARTYPNEEHEGHVVPNEQDFAANPYTAAYTQVVQKAGGISKRGRTVPAELNAKFNEVYHKGGIYSFMSHAQWLDFEPGNFYEEHLKYIGGRPEIWYVPIGPLYAFQRLAQATTVTPLGGNRFAVAAKLDPHVYKGSVTLEFRAPGAARAYKDGKPLPAAPAMTSRWDAEYVRRSSDVLYVTVKPGCTVEIR